MLDVHILVRPADAKRRPNLFALERPRIHVSQEILSRPCMRTWRIPLVIISVIGKVCATRYAFIPYCPSPNHAGRTRARPESKRDQSRDPSLVEP